jgi:membrane-bound lytic murein transglycosylase B
LATTERELAGAVQAWVRTGDTADGAAPEDVTLLALDQQRVLRLLARRPDLAARVLRRQPAGRRRAAQAFLRAARDLRRLNAGHRPHRIRTGAPLPAGELLAAYRAAQRRFGVGWHVLAAVNLVETQFGRLRNNSVSGAQGPMQFMPATWKAYGLGGDPRDPHDAIRGAANYLRASGAPRDYARALYHYNPSPLYVSAVRAYARVMARRPSAFYELYAWQVYVRAPGGGERRVTGPGAA